MFFVTSGMAIDPAAIGAEPLTLVIFVTLILVVRGGSVYLATRYPPASVTSPLDARSSLRVGLYGATGLPIIVAVTAVAVAGGEMSTTNASVLVAGGAFTVLLFPMLATVIARAPSSVP